MRLAFVAMIGAALVGTAVSGAGASSAPDRIDRLETEAFTLQQSVTETEAALKAFMPKPPRIIADTAAPIMVAQSNRDLASVNVRLSQLEEQIRVLTGQVEGLQFQMTQMQTQLQRMQEDYEFRFQQLEGGGLGKTDAASQSGGAALPGGVPQTQTPLQADPGAIDLTGGDANLGDEDFLIDPEAEGFELGAPEQPLGTLQSDDLALGGQPLDLTFDPGGLVTDDDALAQFRAGYDAAQQGDYAFAEDQFRQFIGLFPDHPQAPEATNWLGAALMQRGEYDEAADILLTGYQSYSQSPRAPDLLFNLGVALAGAGERDTACRTFLEVERRHPEAMPALQPRIDEQRANAQC